MSRPTADYCDPTGKVLVAEEDRTQCEVWTRIVGYYRPVALFNLGRQSEHRDRKHFRMPADMQSFRAEEQGHLEV